MAYITLAEIIKAVITPNFLISTAYFANSSIDFVLFRSSPDLLFFAIGARRRLGEAPCNKRKLEYPGCYKNVKEQRQRNQDNSMEDLMIFYDQRA